MPPDISAYHDSGSALVCELKCRPWFCEFWPIAELAAYNSDYEVPTYAPGYFGFATSGGGEMFALSPTGTVVCLAFIGMSSADALPVAPSWRDFIAMLHPAR